MIRTLVIIYLTLIHAALGSMYWLYTNDKYTIARIDNAYEDVSQNDYAHIVGEAGSEARKSTFAVLDKKGGR